MAAIYCILEDNDLAVTLEITVEPNIVAGGDFKLINSQNNEILKNWKITVDYENPSKVRVHSSPKELNKVIMNWEILCCSMNPDIFESTIKFHLKQGGKYCKLTDKLEFTRLNIPPCKVNEPDSFQGSIIFIIRKEMKGF